MSATTLLEVIPISASEVSQSPQSIPQHTDTPAPEPRPQSIPRRGRPRKFSDNAAKQKAYRRSKSKQNQIDAVMREHADSRGMYLPQAARGKGLLVSNTDVHQVSDIQTAQELELGPSGQSPQEVTELRYRGAGARRRVRSESSSERDKRAQSKKERAETAYTFAEKFVFPANWNLDEREKERIVEACIRENIESSDRSTAPEWNPETGSYEPIPDTHRCIECGDQFDRFSQAADHFETAHSKILRKAIRMMRPKQTSKPSSEVLELLDRQEAGLN